MVANKPQVNISYFPEWSYLYDFCKIDVFHYFPMWASVGLSSIYLPKKRFLFLLSFYYKQTPNGKILFIRFIFVVRTWNVHTTRFPSIGQISVLVALFGFYKDSHIFNGHGHYIYVVALCLWRPYN